MPRATSRRSFLAAGCGLPAVCGSGADPEQYRHRGYLGWITDLAAAADPDAAWPSMRLDNGLLRDYENAFALMQTLGFNEISIWGLYVSRAWPLDIESAVSADRAAAVVRLIESAHKHGLRVLSGLGVYSWGFDRIIAANPKLNQGNARAMCASQPESWEWMRRVVDFVFSRFPIDGISMQSADQGRCRCDRCARYSDAEYHALLNTRVTAYVRARWPSTSIGVNSWGLRFEEPDSLPALEQISHGADYLIDVHDSSRKLDPGYRRRVISALHCDFGTIGGPQVEPPQHWNRDRWFLPTAKRDALHLRELYADGGRACEYFFHILANPGDEVTLRTAGRMMSNPREGWEDALASAVEETFETRDPAARDEIAALFVRAEDAYFHGAPEAASGTISLEPLVSAEPGPPVYLTRRLSAEQRHAYAAELKMLAPPFRKLRARVGRKDKVDCVLRSLRNAGEDAIR